MDRTRRELIAGTAAVAAASWTTSAFGADADPYRTHREMTAPGATAPVKRIRNDEDMIFRGDGSKPLSVERSGKGVAAVASIGVVTLGGRGVASLFR